MCMICMATQTFDPLRHAEGEPIFASISERSDAAETFGTAYTMTVGDSFTGTLSSASDEDWVRIELVEGQAYDIQLTGGTLDDPYLRVRDSNGSTIAENDDIVLGRILDSELTFVAGYTGTYYLEADAFSSETGSYTLSVETAAPLEIGTLDELALQLSEGYWGGVEYTFDSPTVTVNLTGLTAPGQQLARWAMEAWEMVANLNFVEVARGGQIVMDDTASGAFAYSPGPSNPAVTFNVSTAWLDSQGTTLDSYSFQTFTHELGHAIGLGHQGNYNGDASYGRNNQFTNDSWQVSVMSYFSQTDNTSINASLGHTAGPMMADILAIQSLYGAPDASSATAGDTIWGAGSNLGNYLDEVFAAMASGNRSANISGEAQAFTIYDRDGTDMLNLGFLTDDSRLDLRSEQFSDIGGLIGNLGIARGTVIENARLGSGDDTVTGNAAANGIALGAGDDRVSGGAGADTLWGGTGDDTLMGNDGADVVYGGDGRDQVFLNRGDDVFYDNTQGGDEGRDSVWGGYGRDTLEGGNGDDMLFGEWGNDVINGRLGNDTIRGGDQFDTVSAGGGDDVVYGGNGRDLIFLNQGDDIFYDNTQGGVLGRDTVFGGYGRDTVEGGAGDDVLHGQWGNDVLRGRLGNDSIYGGSQFDTIDAGQGNDLVFGGRGRDVIDLGAGNDRYIDTDQGGDLGRDIITGGAGADTFVFGTGISQDIITDFEVGVDRLQLSSALVGGRTARQVEDQMFTDTGGDVYFQAGGGQFIHLSSLSTADGIAGSIEIA